MIGPEAELACDLASMHQLQAAILTAMATAMMLLSFTGSGCCRVLYPARGL